MAPGDLPAKYENESCCVHVAVNSHDYFQLHNSLAVLPGSRPTPEDDSIPLAKLQPWIDMIRELLLESHLSPDVIAQLMCMYVPKKHRHAIKPIGVVTTLRTFHPFPRLPKQIRVAIWRMAATRPPRVLFWQNDYDEGGPPLNSPAGGPMAALACKEAWIVTKYRGCSFDMQSIDNNSSSERVPKPIWVAARDLVLAPYGVNPKLCDSDCEPLFQVPDLLRLRKQVAVDYDHFVESIFGGYPDSYRFLGGMKKLDTVVCVIAAPEVCIWTDDDNEDANPGLTKEQLQTTKLFQKLVLLEDKEGVRELDMLWRGVTPEWRWVSRPQHDLLRINADAHAPKFVSRCYECEMWHWEEICLPQLRLAWVRMLYGEGEVPDILCDDGEEIYPNGLSGEPKPDHPWVKDALARMPKFKPAVLLLFKKRRPRYDEWGRRINCVDRKGY
jgi:hypothetical protein